MTSSDTVELYTEDNSLQGDQTLTVQVVLDNTSETTQTFTNTVVIKECEPTLSYPAASLSYTYIVRTTETPVDQDAY